MKIYKYSVPSNQMFEIDMPAEAICLDVQVQNGTPVMWALIPDAELQPVVTRRFCLVMTGQEFESEFDLKYVGTFQMPEMLKVSPNGLVLHLFEGISKS